MLWACMESEEALWRRDWRPTLETEWKMLHYQLKDRGWGPSCAACRQPLDPGEGRIADSSHEPSGGAQPADICGLLTSRPIRMQVLPDKLVL